MRRVFDKIRQWKLDRATSADYAYNSALLELQGKSPVPRRIWELSNLPANQAFQSTNAEEKRVLANALFHGTGMERDTDRAHSLWSAAADQGDLNAKYSLAMSLRVGHGSQKRNPIRARSLLQELVDEAAACSSDNEAPRADAAFALGDMLEQVDDVMQLLTSGSLKKETSQSS